MNSLVCIAPGDLEYRQKQKPSLSKGKAIVRIRRIGVCGTDLHAFQGNQPFFTYPRILGHELSGELEDADGVDGLNKGDAVSIIPYLSCGSCIACRTGRTNCCVTMKVCGVHVDGGMVDYFAVPITHLISSNKLTFEELAMVEPLAIGAHAVGRAAIMPGEFVLVIGAGPIGLGTMEFASLAGGKVIALDISEKRLHFCRSHLNVHGTVDGRSANVLEQLQTLTGGEMPTVIMDATGNRAAINNAFQYMAHGSRYILVGLQMGEISFSHPEFHKREGTLMSSRNATRSDFETVAGAFDSGKIDAKKYITHRVQFSQVKDEFAKWLQPEAGVIKAMIEM